MNQNMIINGQATKGLGKPFCVLNPANEEVIATLGSASLAQVSEAVTSAATAFKEWKNVTDDELTVLFTKIADEIRIQKDEIASLITLEQGKPLFFSKMEVEAGLKWIDYIKKLEIPVDIIQEKSGKIIKIYNRPIGVVASITPWNWPFMIALWHILPALKAKNCVVNKPSEFTPLSTIKLFEIINKFLPAGVCNLILGQGQVGDELTKHPGIEKVTFTGSTRTGQIILNNSIETLKSVVLELGGNDGAIVLSDVDIEQTAEKIFNIAFLNMGQTCTAIKRLYIHEDIYDTLTQKLVEIANRQKIGDGLNIENTFGPVQNYMQYQKVRKLISEAVADGGEILTIARDLPQKGYFIPPTIITNIDAGIALVDEEQFGPALPVIKFTTIEEVISKVNASNYGLGGSVWTNNIELAEEIASKIESGSVWINNHAEMSPDAEFYGWKMSGLGHSFGISGLLQFTKKQAIHINM